MPLYCGIDLHSTSSHISVIDETDQELLSKKVGNRLGEVLGELEPYRDELVGVVVESTFNWYWLVDGLMDAGYAVHLANPAAMTPYTGLKYTDDRHDARWLAHLLRLDLLPTGYIYPKAERAVRDLLRRRGQLVRQRTSSLLSLQNLWIRTTGEMLRGNALKSLCLEQVRDQMGSDEQVLAVESTMAVIDTLDQQIKRVERAALAQGRLKEGYEILTSIPGVGKVIGLTILYETGDVSRFPGVGHYASYCRCVDSKRMSHGKKKGAGNRRNGNRYLSWAFIEAANFAVRYEPRARRYFERKQAKKNRAYAVRALASKLARASYYMMRDGTWFAPDRLFA